MGISSQSAKACKLSRPCDSLTVLYRGMQVEFYFSDANLPTDKHLLKQISKDPEGYGELPGLQSLALAAKQVAKLAKLQLQHMPPWASCVHTTLAWRADPCADPPLAVNPCFCSPSEDDCQFQACQGPHQGAVGGH